MIVPILGRNIAIITQMAMMQQLRITTCLRLKQTTIVTASIKAKYPPLLSAGPHYCPVLVRNIRSTNTLRYKSMDFYPHNALLVWYIPWPCVCLSITSRCCTKVAKCKITKRMSHNSPKDLHKILMGHSQWGCQMQVGVGKNCSF